ncbi:MAG TPA: hypothetical protein VGD71_28770 [Kribbella sp.]|jgi:hypothetical protein
MSDLLDLALKAHGGLERWNALSTGHAHVSAGGLMFELKGHAPDAGRRHSEH